MINSSISRVISRLRFPLMVGVVFIHSKSIFIKPEMPLLSNIATFFSSILPSFCVPLFFTFSGYLFFASTPNLTPCDYGRKLKKRFRTLAVPYLFWNSLTIAALWITGRLVPSIANPVFETTSSTPPRIVKMLLSPIRRISYRLSVLVCARPDDSYRLLPYRIPHC